MILITKNEHTNLTVYLIQLVNIGSGVSILKVDGPGPNDFTRISGTSVRFF